MHYYPNFVKIDQMDQKIWQFFYFQVTWCHTSEKFGLKPGPANLNQSDRLTGNTLKLDYPKFPVLQLGNHHVLHNI